MTAKKYILSIILLSHIFSSSTYAQQSTTVPQNSPLFLKAKALASLGGGAKYCGEDKNVIEEFYTKAQLSLSKLAKDDYEQTFVQVEFKNLMLAFTVKKPTEKCDSIALKIKDFLR